jgi:hypothetical protein
MHDFSAPTTSLWPKIKRWIQQKQGFQRLLTTLVQNKMGVAIFCFIALSGVLEQKLKRHYAAQQLARLV